MYIEKATENFMTIEDIVINPKTFKQNPDKPYPSTGWWGGGKLTDDDGVTYQVQAQAVLHKSSELGTPEPTEALKLGTQTIARKRGKDGSDGFGTGSKGYYFSGAVVTPHGTVQLMLQAVIVGSKPDSIEANEAKLAKQEAALAAQAAKLADRRKGLEALKASVA